MKPFFSIIVPVYNVASWLRECLDSIKNQTFGDWEAICVDDGSTDGSPAILDEYAARDSRFRVIHKSNGGVSSARNAALDVARGDWLMFLDGDDCYRKDALQWLKNASDANSGSQIIAFKTKKFPDGAIVPCEKECHCECSVIDVSEHIDDREWLSYFAGKAYVRSLCGDLRFDERLSNGEDVLFVTQAVLRAKSVIATGCELYLYRRRDDSMTLSKPQLKFFIDYSTLAPIYYNVLATAGKRVPREVVVNRSKRFTGLYIYQLKNLASADRTMAYSRWLEMAGKARKYGSVPLRFRMIFWCCSILRMEIFAYVLCALPLLVKMKILRIIKRDNT